MDDLISRVELLAAYDKAHKGPPGGARKLIEEAPAVDAVQQPEWISCAERLPEFDKEVLVINSGLIRVYSLYHSKLLGKDVWEDEKGFYQDFEDVTHWMPLPEPPKEDE